MQGLKAYMLLWSGTYTPWYKSDLLLQQTCNYQLFVCTFEFDSTVCLSCIGTIVEQNHICQNNEWNYQSNSKISQNIHI